MVVMVSSTVSSRFEKVVRPSNREDIDYHHRGQLGLLKETFISRFGDELLKREVFTDLLVSLPGKPPCPNMHDEHAGAARQRGEEEGEGGWGLPERDEREYLGDGDSVEEQRGVGAEALPHDGGPRRNRETKPTTFETLTRRVDTLVVWHGLRICAKPPLPSHQLSKKLESVVVVRTIAVCFEQTIGNDGRRTKPW